LWIGGSVPGDPLLLAREDARGWVFMFNTPPPCGHLPSVGEEDSGVNKKIPFGIFK